MKRRLAITIDEDIYNELEQLPRRVSISEVINWFVRAAFYDIRSGRVLSDKELQDWIDSTPEGRDFRQRLIEHYGSTFEKIDSNIESVKQALRLKKRKS